MQLAKQINFGVIGPASADDNAVARFDGATGKKIQNSLTLVSDLGLLTTSDAVIGASAKSGTEKFRVTGGSVLFDGTTGGTPVSGAGARLMWIPEKAAFRAGKVSGTQWDTIGSYSMGLGQDTKPTGSDSVAIGSYTEASAAGAIAIGYSAKALADRNITIGGVLGSPTSLTTGNSSGGSIVLASAVKPTPPMGGTVLAQSTGIGSVVIGLSLAYWTAGATLEATGAGAVVIGAAAQGTHSVAGDYSVSIGKNNTVTDDDSIVIGSNLNSTNQKAFAIGYNFTNNTPTSFMVGFSAVPTLQVCQDKMGVNRLPTTYALEVNGQIEAIGGFVDNGSVGVDGWFDDGVNFRITVSGGIITAIANSTAGGHS